MGFEFGYACISTTKRGLDRQLDAMAAAVPGRRRPVIVVKARQS